MFLLNLPALYLFETIVFKRYFKVYLHFTLVCASDILLRFKFKCFQCTVLFQMFHLTSPSTLSDIKFFQKLQFNIRVLDQLLAIFILHIVKFSSVTLSSDVTKNCKSFSHKYYYYILLYASAQGVQFEVFLLLNRHVTVDTKYTESTPCE